MAGGSLYNKRSSDFLKLARPTIGSAVTTTFLYLVPGLLLEEVGAHQKQRALLDFNPVRIAALAESVESVLRESKMPDDLTIVEADTA